MFQMMYILSVSTILLALCRVYCLWWSCRYTRTLTPHTHRRVVPPAVYAIMVTGKDTQRITWARRSWRNWCDQQYLGPKHMIIVNHHPTQRVFSSGTAVPAHAQEIVVHKVGNVPTLGAMRNLAVQQVPMGCLWTTWDDDDYRSTDYVATLYRVMGQHKCAAVSFTHRLEHNVNTGLSWKLALTTSGFVTMLIHKQPSNCNFAFLDQDTMEDVHIRSHFPDRVLYCNPHHFMYLRLVHHNNTSLWVNKWKAAVHTPQQRDGGYAEATVSKDEAALIKRILTQHFRLPSAG